MPERSKMTEIDGKVAEIKTTIEKMIDRMFKRYYYHVCFVTDKTIGDVEVSAIKKIITRSDIDLLREVVAEGLKKDGCTIVSFQLLRKEGWL
jgi:hypothetical protein